ncbi:MAG: ABC transporter substrate-binding protein, partial [Candidatus Marinimicrobia bacterium]|nr:ABC transporter substrate-binding protein [Candidatus Neomarinimicrobiota bacterium]
MKTLSPILLAIIFFSCGGGSDSSSSISKTDYELVPKDTVTKPEDGGYGFENIAASMDYETYVFTDEDYQYFGDPDAKKGGNLKFTSSRFPATMRVLGQHYNYTENYYVIGDLCYQGLINTHPVTLEYIPSLASHWKLSDDKMVFYFRIDPDARWSDGQEVTAEDIVASYDIRMDETILFPSTQATYGKIHRPEIVSKYIVKVRSKNLNWRNMLYFGGMYILPEHYLKDLDGTAYLEEYNFKLLPGSGPYVIKEEDIVNQESYALTRRDDWWGADARTSKYLYNFDKITISVVKDNPTLQFEKLKKGEADAMVIRKPSMWVDETNFDATDKGWLQKRRVQSKVPAGTWGYAFNMRKWPFDDKRVRYAFSYLYDREKFNREILYNEYTLQNSLYSGSEYENPNNNKFEFNPKKAVALLKEAGYVNRNEDGYLVHKNTGKVLSFTIETMKPAEYRITPMQQILKEYGIDMQIKFVDSTTRWKNLMDRNFTIDFQAWGGLVYPNPETSFKSTLADQKNNNNIAGVKSERIDKLLPFYDTEFDHARRVEIIQEIDGIVSDIHPSAWGLSREPPARLLFWNKFGYPEYMLSKYGGRFYDILAHWWFEPDKEDIL